MRSKKITPNNNPVRKNNFVQDGQIPKKIQYIIKFETLFGINRLRLVSSTKFLLGLCYAYTFCVVAFTVYFRIFINAHNTTQLVFNLTVALEYLVLSFTSVSKSRSFVELFDDLRASESNSKYRSYIFSFLAVLCYDIFEFIFNDAYFYESNLDIEARGAILVALFAHDVETLFFCSLLALILRRVELLRERVSRIFILNEQAFLSEESNLSPEMLIATASFYKEYELIHKCSKHLNNLIGLPILAMLLSSGLCTILIMKTVVQHFNSNALEHYNIMLVGIARCLKYIFLIVSLCFFSTVTSNQVENIQIILHETLNTQEITKVERRNIKAFLQLTKDNQIVYLLGGIVKLDMALPLNYCSICTTYLLIVIQFSKFLD